MILLYHLINVFRFQKSICEFTTRTKKSKVNFVIDKFVLKVFDMQIRLRFGMSNSINMH